MDLEKIKPDLTEVLRLFICVLVIIFYISRTMKFDEWISIGILLLIFFILGLDFGYQLKGELMK